MIMQFIVINFRSLILAVIVFSFLNGIETADLSQTFKDTFENTIVLQRPVTIELANGRSTNREYGGKLIVDSITNLKQQTTFQATKANEKVRFELQIPHFTVTGGYCIKGAEGTDGSNQFSGDSTFSLELENFTYNDTLPFVDGSLQLQLVDDGEKANYRNLSKFTLRRLKFDDSGDDVSKATIEDIARSAKDYLTRHDQLLVEIQNALQLELSEDRKLNMRL